MSRAQWNADSDTDICTDKFFEYDHFIFGHFGDKTLLDRIHINPPTLPQKVPKPPKFQDCSVASGGILCLWTRWAVHGLPLLNAHPIQNLTQPCPKQTSKVKPTSLHSFPEVTEILFV